MGDFIEFTTLPEQQLIFYKITSSAIGFSVRGERHAAVGLAERPFQKCEYWIVFGESQCWVEIDGTRTNVNEVPNILSRQFYTKYWISWHSACLQFGRTSDGVPLITREIPVQDLHFVTFFVYADRGTQQWKIFLPPKLQKPFLKRVEGGDMHWVDAEDKLPDGALIGGYEKEILYIIKASHHGYVMPGKLAASQGAGYIAWGTQMLKKNTFQRRSSIAVRRVAPEPTAPTAPTVCATPSPRPRCRIRTNPWLGTSPNARRRAPSVLHQQSLQCPQAPTLQHAPYSLDSHPKYGSRSPHLSPRLSPHLSPHLSPEPYRTPYYRGGVSSDEECRGMKPRGRETAILSDADVDSDGDTGLDGGDEDEPDSTASPSKRRARRRRPPRRPPRSAGATPPRMRRRCHAPSAPPVRERDPLLEADREAERKYRELIREAEKLLVTVSRSPIEPPHNPRVRELRATEVDAPRRSPERTHVTNFIRANSPEPPRRLSPVARRSPLAAPPPPRPQVQPPSPTDRPHSEPPKRKAYARDEVLQTLEGLRKSLQQQSALLAVQRTRLDSF